MRAAYETFKEMKRLKTPMNLEDIEEKIQYGIGIEKRSEKNYGTIENLKDEYPTKINNVRDKAKALTDSSEDPHEIRSNEQYYS